MSLLPHPILSGALGLFGWFFILIGGFFFWL